MTASIPAATAYSASESPAFPCVGTASRVRPSDRAIDTVMAMPAILERERRIAPESRVVLPLVLDLQPASQPFGQRMRIGQARRIALAQRRDVPAILGRVEVERQQAAKPPKIAPIGIPPAVAAPLRPSRSRSSTTWSGRPSCSHRFMTRSAGYSASQTVQAR